MSAPAGRLRRIAGFALLLAGLLAWIPGSDVIDLVVREHPVLMGRYSQGHFTSLFFGTLLLWMEGILLLVPAKSTADRVFACIMVPLSTGLAFFALLIASGFIFQPRYIERSVAATDVGKQMKLQGLIRHRPANEHYNLTFTDKPENARSYPGRPGGFGTLPIVFSTDRNGFRNAGVLEQYPIIAVGDSFTTGSNVSDEQVWTVLLSQAIHQPIYNLGVGGASPRVYLNNYAVLGQQFHPKTAIFTIYEGNDLQYEPLPVTDTKTGEQKLSLSERIEYLGKASPVTLGLRRLSDDVLQHVGADWPIRGYEQAVGWMPVHLSAGGSEQYYAFHPKRLRYLNVTPDEFAQSLDWTSTRDVLLDIRNLTRENGTRLVFVYAASTPHVVLPLVKDQVPADQLHRFLAYETKRLPDAATLKERVFANLDSEEQVFMQFCADNGIECVSTTQAMRDAMLRGEQVYYTYDQHWTPLGNAVMAKVVQGYLEAHP